MDYERMLEEGNIEDLEEMQEAAELANIQLESEATEDTKFETCSICEKNPDVLYYVTINENRCGQVEGDTLYMCQYHHQYVIDKRSKFPIKDHNI